MNTLNDACIYDAILTPTGRFVDKKQWPSRCSVSWQAAGRQEKAVPQLTALL